MIQYCIVLTAQLPLINFNEFLNNSKELTYNNNKELCILRFKGAPPKSLEKIIIQEFANRLFHTHAEIIELKKIVSSNPIFKWVQKQ